MSSSLKEQLLAKEFQEAPQKEKKFNLGHKKREIRSRLLNAPDEKMVYEINKILAELKKEVVETSLKKFAFPLRELRRKINEDGEPTKSERKKIIKNLW